MAGVHLARIPLAVVHSSSCGNKEKVRELAAVYTKKPAGAIFGPLTYVKGFPAVGLPATVDSIPRDTAIRTALPPERHNETSVRELADTSNSAGKWK